MWISVLLIHHNKLQIPKKYTINIQTSMWLYQFKWHREKQISKHINKCSSHGNIILKKIWEELKTWIY